MCGIVGIYLKTKKYEKQLGKFLSGMLDGMATRGPASILSRSFLDKYSDKDSCEYAFEKLKFKKKNKNKKKYFFI